MLTTFYSYGEVQESRQAEILMDLKQPQARDATGQVQVDVLAKALAREMIEQSKCPD